MNETQFLIAIAMGPVMSLVIVIVGYVVQNSNLNARTGEIRAEIKDLLRAELGALRSEQRAFADTYAAELRTLRTEQKALADTYAAELRAVRAEMAKNHSELLTALASHEHRITKP